MGWGVVCRDVAETFGAGDVEALEFVDIGDEQGGVVVEDVADLEPVLTPRVSEVWGAVSAADLEPRRTAAGLHRLLRDEPEGEGDVDVSA